jgi:hypothetical protein
MSFQHSEERSKSLTIYLMTSLWKSTYFLHIVDGNSIIATNEMEEGVK